VCYLCLENCVCSVREREREKRPKKKSEYYILFFFISLLAFFSLVKVDKKYSVIIYSIVKPDFQ